MKKYKKACLVLKDQASKTLIELQEFYENHYKQSLPIVTYNEKIEFEEDTIYFLYLDDELIKKFLFENKDQKLNLSILPNEDSTQSITRYGLSKDIYEAFDDAFREELRVNDQLLICNEQVVFNKISIGNVQNFSRYSDSTWANIKRFFKNLKNLRYQAITFETEKKNSLKTVVSGVLVLEDYTVYKSFRNIENSSFHDGKLNAFIISPSSILSYIYHFLIIVFYHKFSLNRLPCGIGFISTKKLSLSSGTPFEFTVDSVAVSSKEIHIDVVQSELNINYGKKFEESINEKNQYDEKESFNVRYLPKGELKDLLIKGRIPLLKKASDEDMKETFTSIKEGAKVTSIFITLMILSTLLATVGIFQDSTPSVIGAMILAPLMTPIISLAMGMVRSDNLIIKRSVLTLGLGILSALFFSSLVTLMIPLDSATSSQIYSRINPNLLDLFVAIFSGIAGAYAASKEEVAKSLAGVAIAVALVPPLCVSGIGIGWGEFNIVYGSFLLFLTNLFGVIVAAAITFIILGFAPIHRAKKGIVYSSIMVLVISIPLYFSFLSLIEQNQDYERLQNIKSIELYNKKVSFNIISVNNTSSDKTVINLEVISTTPLNSSEYSVLKGKIEKILDKEITLYVIPKLIIE